MFMRHENETYEIPQALLPFAGMERPVVFNRKKAMQQQQHTHALVNSTESSNESLKEEYVEEANRYTAIVLDKEGKGEGR